MTKGKSFAGYLLIVLLLSLSSGQGLYPNTSFPASSYTKITTTAVAKQAIPTVSITTPSIRKDKIRVRYMGGECRYDGATIIPVAPVFPQFIDHVKWGTYVSFISSGKLCLCKLRGPPQFC